MRTGYCVLIVVIAAIGFTLIHPCMSYAQDKSEDFIDCRENQCTTETMVHALITKKSKVESVRALNVYFDTNKAIIRQEFYPDLNALGEALKQLSTPPIEISGHTDSRGSSKLNQRLSELRAQSVKTYLVDYFSIPKERLIAKGYGSRRLRFPEDSPDGQKKNRRIEVARIQR